MLLLPRAHDHDCSKTFLSAQRCAVRMKVKLNLAPWILQHEMLAYKQAEIAACAASECKIGSE